MLGLLNGLGLTAVRGGGGAIVYDNAAAALLTNKNGFAVSFIDMSMKIKSSTEPVKDFEGLPSAKLVYTSPFTKWIRGSDGLYASGTTLRTEYDANGLPLGLLAEEARTNRCLWNRDLTNAAWTKTNATAAKTSTGIDGVVNSASTLTATAGNGTCLQAITSASAARITSAFIKRRTGTGVIEMTQDNGGTWTAVTASINASTWTMVNVPSATVTNPTVGFRIVTSGDEIDVDFVQEETGAFVTSPIEVTTVAVARTADRIELAVSNFTWGTTQGGLFATSRSKYGSTGTARTIVSINQNSALEQFVISETTNQITTANGADASFAVTALIGQTARTALSWMANDCDFYLNGVRVNGAASLALPNTPVRVAFGQGANTNQNFLNGHIQEVLYIDEKQTDAYWVTKTTAAPPAETFDLIADFHGGDFEWGGEARLLSDLTDNGDGSYSLTNDISWWDQDHTIIIDYFITEANYAATPSGILFSTVSETNQSDDFGFVTVAPPPYDRFFPRMVYTGASHVMNMTGPGGGAPMGRGLHRVGFVNRLAAFPILAANNISQAEPAVATPRWTRPKKISFGRKASDDSNLLGDATVRRVALYPRKLSSAQLTAAMKDGVREPIHFLCDSFGNSNLLVEEVSLFSAATGYIAYSNDFVGGANLYEHLARWQLTPQWWDSTLVIMDGALELVDPGEAVGVIQQIVSYLTHSRWLYIQSNPINPIGDSRRTTWEAIQLELQAAFPDNYVPSLAAIQAANDGSPTDLADVADGLYPTSLAPDGIHLYTTHGNAVLGEVIFDALAAEGWA